MSGKVESLPSPPPPPPLKRVKAFTSLEEYHVAVGITSDPFLALTAEAQAAISKALGEN